MAVEKAGFTLQRGALGEHIHFCPWRRRQIGIRAGTAGSLPRLRHPGRYPVFFLHFQPAQAGSSLLCNLRRPGSGRRLRQLPAGERFFDRLTAGHQGAFSDGGKGERGCSLVQVSKLPGGRAMPGKIDGGLPDEQQPTRNRPGTGSPP